MRFTTRDMLWAMVCISLIGMTFVENQQYRKLRAFLRQGTVTHGVTMDQVTSFYETSYQRDIRTSLPIGDHNFRRFTVYEMTHEDLDYMIKELSK